MGNRGISGRGSGAGDFFTWQAPALIEKRGLSAVMRLIRERRITRCVMVDEKLSGEVYDFEGLAREPQIIIRSGECRPDCDCGEAGLCIHGAALLMEAATRGLLPESESWELDSLRGDRDRRPPAASIGRGAQEDLFSDSGAAGNGHKSRRRAEDGAPVRYQGSPASNVGEPPPEEPEELARAAAALVSGAPMAPLIKIYTDRNGTGIEFRFRYPWGEVGWRDTPGDREAHELRDSAGENDFVDRIRRLLRPELMFERGPYADLFKDGPPQDLQIEGEPSEFLMRKGRMLLNEGIEVQVENRRVRVDRELALNIASDLDLLDIRAALVPQRAEAGKDAGYDASLRIDSDNLKRGMVEANGEYVLLTERDLRQLEYLRRRGMSSEGVISASGINMILLERIYEQVADADRRHLDDHLKVKRILDDSSALPQSVPPRGLATELRNYQQFGYSWLCYMLENGMNPCLADDMGLGKTLQTIALMLGRYEGGNRGPFLVVCPVVTMANWESEIARFAPGLPTAMHRGGGRAEEAEDLPAEGVILVSYQTLRSDLAMFLETQWDLLILDEAHYIKNIQSQMFKTVRSLRSAGRISLTGTPIENSVMELFAQMDFLNPGLLGSPRQFYSDFFRGIQREGDENLLEELKDLVRPFILRRTKDEVLGELPGKEIIVRPVEMGRVQREAYDFHRRQILETIEQEKDPRARGTLVFRSLLTLRQLAIHPPLADPAHRDLPSAKMDALELLMGDILEEDHKVLIFSQFVGSLEAIADLCRRRGWGHLLLTGQTRNRQEEVSRFQEDPDAKVFLLSLKAGGVGINLTAADYVILFDPWWNPAAEQQAIDRAHRMGQTRRVIAYKLIVRDSIEEKILDLQEQKSNLADEIISGGGSLLSHLDRDQMLELFS
jgi:superfamily II DNA or RNA helicase